MMVLRVFVLLLASPFVAVANEDVHCVTPLTNSPAGGKFASQITMRAGGIELSGNDMGVQGHKTTLTQCSIRTPSGELGWNWTRGTTEKRCSTVCPYQSCYYQFGFHHIQYGINAWGGSSGASEKLNLPQNSDDLASLDVNIDVAYVWTDLHPVTMGPIYRSRLIHDFFLTTESPVAQQSKADTITDEIVIELAYNADFELPCGYNPSANHSIVVRDAIITSDGQRFDVSSYADWDKPCKSCGPNRITQFRRQGGACSGTGAACPVPRSLDLMPFIKFAQSFKPKERSRPAGPWVGDVSIGTEIYDNTQGSVMFKKFEVLPRTLGQKDVVVI